VGKIFTFIVLLLAVVAGLMFSPFSKGIEVGALTKKLSSLSKDMGLFDPEPETENLTGVFVDNNGATREDIDTLIKSAPTLNVDVNSESAEKLDISAFGKELISNDLSSKNAERKPRQAGNDNLVSSLREEITIRDQELAETAAENRKLSKEITKLNSKLRSRAQPLSTVKSDDPQGTIRMLKESEADLLRKVVEYRKEVRSLSKKLSTFEQKPSSSGLSTEVNRLKKEVISLKGKLKLKEEEVSALSAGKPYRPRSQNDQQSSAPTRPAQQKAVRAPAPETRAPLAAATPTKSSSRDLRVKVTVPKANLRTGPGKKHGVVTQIAKGVVLSAESRSGSWYRVLDPTGKRAFISSDVVRVLKPQVRSSLALQTESKPALQPRRASRAEVPEGFVPFDDKKPAPKTAPGDVEKRAFDQLKSRLSR